MKATASAVIVFSLMVASIGSVPSPLHAAEQHQTATAVPVHVLAKSDGPQVCLAPCYYLISNTDRFRTFWNRALANVPTPHINFSKQVVAIASEGLLPNSGFNSIDIQKAVQTGRKLKITIHQVDGDGGPSFYNTPDWPFVVATLPRTFTQFQFIVHADRYSCSVLNLILCADPSSSLLSGGRCNPVQQNYRSARCYSPSGLPKVEEFLNRKIPAPSATIQLMTHLRLRRIIVFLPQITTTASADVYFIYGRTPSSIAGLNMSQTKPSFVVVRENAAGEAYTGSPPAPILEKSTFHLHTNSPPSQTLLAGPWQFGAKIPHQHRWITVIADARSSVVQKIGNRVLEQMVSAESK